MVNKNYVRFNLHFIRPYFRFSNGKIIRRHVIALSYNSAIVLCEDSLNCDRNRKRGSFVKQVRKMKKIMTESFINVACPSTLM